MRDDVLGIVAHDLRSPLNSILIASDILRAAEPSAGNRSDELAEVILRSALRMDGLIQDLLDIARMEAGHLSIEAERLSAVRIVTDAVGAEHVLAASDRIDLRVDVADTLPEVWADRDRLLQVFDNLIGNALKFTPRGGRVTVGATLRDDEVMFWVADSGPGIAAADLQHLFDRFWQARKTGRRGAGLGLPIAKGIVEAHGGSIWAESTPNRGSTFYCTIPTASRMEPSQIRP